jgi:hypothetical protein
VLKLYGASFPITNNRAMRSATSAANSAAPAAANSAAPAAPAVRNVANVFDVHDAPAARVVPAVPPAVPPGSSAARQDVDFLSTEAEAAFRSKLNKRINAKLSQLAGDDFDGPVAVMLAALQELLEDPRGDLSILSSAADLPEDPSLNLSTVGPAADLPAHTGFRILLDALTLEIVASREVQSCRMVWRVLKQTLDHYGARQSLLTDVLDPALASQPALAMRLGKAVLRARIVERCEASNSTHHDDVQAFGGLMSTVRMEEYARHLPSTDQLPANEQTLSANVASGRATARVNEERIDVRNIRHGPGTPGWQGPEQERNVCLVNANASQGAVGSGPPGDDDDDDDDDDDEEDYGRRGSGRGPGRGISRPSRRGAESYHDHEFRDSRRATDYMLWSKTVASAFDTRVKKAPRAFSGNLDDGNSYSDWKCVFSRITGRNGLDVRDPGMLICLLGSATCDCALTFLASDVLYEGTSKPKRIDNEMPATTISEAFERIEAYFLGTPARAELREEALGLELRKV